MPYRKTFRAARALTQDNFAKKPRRAESTMTMTSKNWTNKGLIWAGALALTLALAHKGEAQEACSVYTVQQGDTLAGIAETAYGSFDYQQIFNANRNLITNPNVLDTGVALQLPCADGNLPGAGSAAQVIAQAEATQAEQVKPSNAFEPPIKIVSGNGWAPFVGENFEGGGMLVRLATTALNRGGNARDYNVSFVDDWASHTETLLPLGAFDVSVAWYMPNCAKVDMLSDGMQKRCNELDGSLPIYESVVGFYTLPDNKYADVRTYADFAGARICRPEGWYTFDLEEQGLIDPVVTMVAPKTVEECFEQMQAGAVDVVPLEVESVAGTARDMGIAGEIVQNAYLTNILSMSFVTHKTNPRGRVYLALLNRGLTEMRESGEWYAIISSGLAEANRMKTATN
ncbi:MAG: transporter substrate-binding domain-containing protein [Silicimonas sp.]|nr:transporter substrate-binding domain-containing protein [Silicimonas sp.]